MANFSVLIAIERTTLQNIKNAVRQPNPPPAARLAARFLRTHIEGLWRTVSVGADNFVILHIIVNQAELTRLAGIAKVIILGGWTIDGLQIGTSRIVTQDASGNQTETIVGTPTYPISARLIDSMPDKVRLNFTNHNVTRTRPDKVDNVNLIAGWMPRRF